MEFQVRSPRNPIEWVFSVLAIAVVMAVGVVLAGLSIIVIGVFILIAPILNWWRQRKAPMSGAGASGAGASGAGAFEPGAAPQDQPQDVPSGRVIDVDYEISDDS